MAPGTTSLCYGQLDISQFGFFQAIELYRKANHFLEGARLLFDVAKAETAKHSRYEE